MNESFFQRIKEGIQDMCYIWVKEIRSSVTDEGVLIFCILVPILSIFDICDVSFYASSQFRG